MKAEIVKVGKVVKGVVIGWHFRYPVGVYRERDFSVNSRRGCQTLYCGYTVAELRRIARKR